MTTLLAEPTETVAQEKFFAASGGTALFYRAWKPPSADRAVIILDRGHEHSGRMVELAESLLDERTAVFAWDARGHGRSPGERGYAESFSTFVRDLELFARHIAQEYGIGV